MITLEDIQQICSGFPSVTTDIKWENHLCFNIGDKFFIITSPDSVPVTASFKVKDERFEELSTHPGCRPAAYLGRYKWVYTDDINRFSRKEWEMLLKEAYALIASKLPAKKRKELGVE